MWWCNSSRMICIDGIGSSVVDYAIFYIPLCNQITNFHISNDHEPDWDHIRLILTLDFVMHSDPTEENYHSENLLMFDRNKDDIFINDLKNDLFPLSSMDNIEHLYHIFSTVISSSINKFSIKFSG